MMTDGDRTKRPNWLKPSSNLSGAALILALIALVLASTNLAAYVLLPRSGSTAPTTTVFSFTAETSSRGWPCDEMASGLNCTGYAVNLTLPGNGQSLQSVNLSLELNTTCPQDLLGPGCYASATSLYSTSLGVQRVACDIPDLTNTTQCAYLGFLPAGPVTLRFENIEDEISTPPLMVTLELIDYGSG